MVTMDKEFAAPIARTDIIYGNTKQQCAKKRNSPGIARPVSPYIYDVIYDSKCSQTKCSKPNHCDLRYLFYM